MYPDRGFTKQLHALDPELEVVWDWGSDKWEIWRFPKDGTEEHHVLTVQTKDRSYRELGMDVLLKLREGAWLARMPLNNLLNYFEEMENQEQRRKQKAFADLIHDITLETMDYQRGVIKIQVPRTLKIRKVIESA